MNAHLLREFDERMAFIGSHEIDALADVVFDVARWCGPEAAFKFLGRHWSGFEVTSVWAQSLASCATSRNRVRLCRAFMSKEELTHYKSLPPEVTVYRGGDSAGVSWSLDIEVARRFVEYSKGSRRCMFGFGTRDPRLWSGIVGRAGIAGVKLDREEKEIVVFPGAVREIREVAS